MNNTTTARDLGMLLAAISNQPPPHRSRVERCRHPGSSSSKRAFRPVCLQDVVYHKTGWIGQVVYHDAALVEPVGSRGRRYVLVVLTGGIEKDEDSHALVRDISRLVFDARGGDAPAVTVGM